MTVDQLASTATALYADLLTALREQRAFHRPELPPGTLSSKTVAGGRYWYVQYAELGERRQVYLGPDDEETRARVEVLRETWADLKADREASARLVASLLASGITPFDSATARVLDVLDEQGLFASGVTLVGTNAFLAYQGVLGVRWLSAARTADIDIAAERNVALVPPVDLMEALDATGLPFHAVPALDPHAPSTSFKVRRKELRVDVLVPLVGAPSTAPVPVPGLGAHAMPLRYLDYLIEGPVDAALACRRGILVRVPDPARFALHKLLVAMSRPIADQAKRSKDLSQAEQLIAVLGEDRPGALTLAWEALCARSDAWEQKARAALRQLPEHVAGLLGDR